jgi:hypothetical protein
MMLDGESILRFIAGEGRAIGEGVPLGVNETVGGVFIERLAISF